MDGNYQVLEKLWKGEIERKTWTKLQWSIGRV